MDLKEFSGLDHLKTDHNEYYGSIVEKLGYERVKNCVPFEFDQIKKAIKSDKHLNNLPLKQWDFAAGFTVVGDKVSINDFGIRNLMRQNKINCYSVAEGVCILKECARMMVEREI